MEDAATAEIARSQLWQWINLGAVMETGEQVTLELCRRVLKEETEKLAAQGADQVRLESARELLDGLISAREFPEFLTLAAYGKLD
jgi:malate synthase